MATLDEEDLQALYTWVDDIPLTRPKRNIARDFADGVLMAEIVKHFFPKLVDLHNYSAAHSISQKLYNWNTLNQKVFKKLDFHVSRQELEDVANGTPGTIEILLRNFQLKVEEYKARKAKNLHNESHDSAGYNSDGSPLYVSPTSKNFDPNVVPVMYPASQTLQPQQQQPQVLPQHTANQQAHSARAPQQPQKQGNQHPPQQQQQRGNQQPHQQANNVISNNNVAQLVHGMGNMAIAPQNNSVDAQLLREKDETIAELRETIEILELKVKKLEQLVRIKDSKILTLTTKIQQAGLR
eukprot:GEZU01009653.1.p1 GENE.GEZU01009653.1~~GEZU01009653.1.p1  ORF type:complete len:296 (+),score=56.66 GEZU01009653.1:248-1135(+)